MSVSSIIITFLASFGSLSAFLLIASKFFISKLDVFIDRKIDYTYEKKLEQEKGEIEKKTHISKEVFDKEYMILQELYSYAFEFTHLMYTCIIDITSNKSTENESGEDPYNEYCKKCHNFTMCFYKNYPFLNKDVAEVFEKTVKKVNSFLTLLAHVRERYERYKEEQSSDAYINSVVRNIDTLWEIHDEMNTGTEYGWIKLSETIRDYMKSIEVA